MEKAGEWVSRGLVSASLPNGRKGGRVGAVPASSRNGVCLLSAVFAANSGTGTVSSLCRRVEKRYLSLVNRL